MCVILCVRVGGWVPVCVRLSLAWERLLFQRQHRESRQIKHFITSLYYSEPNYTSVPALKIFFPVLFHFFILQPQIKMMTGPVLYGVRLSFCVKVPHHKYA